MKPDEASPAPVLTIRNVQFPAPAEHKLDLELRPADSKAVVLHHDELSLLDAMLSGEPVPLSGEVTLCGRNPAAGRVWCDHLQGRVARTFSPLFGYACWLENLDVDENIMLASLMRGADPDALRARALTLARRFGLGEVPGTRRAATPVETLAVCQWIRALLVDGASLFLMVDALRNAPANALSALTAECQARRADGAAFLWLLPKGHGRQARMLGVDEVIEPEDAELPNIELKS